MTDTEHNPTPLPETPGADATVSRRVANIVCECGRVTP